jgi:cysteine-rich repeat protein
MDIGMLTIKKIDSHPEFLQRTYGWATLWDESDHLIFSHPVQLIIPVDSSLSDGDEMAVYVMHAWDQKFNSSGLTTDPNALCDEWWNASPSSNIVTIANWLAIIYTCGASTFVVTYTWWATAANFVDNASLSKTISVTGWMVLNSWTIQDLNVIIDFHGIDGTDPTAPGWWQSRSNEISMTLQSPVWTTISLLNTNTYTNPAAPRVTVTFDDSAWGAPSGLPATGTFTSASALTAFNGEDPIGDWTYTISDNANDDWAILFSASLQINALECWDGLVEWAEQCDDGNTNDSDGCSGTCTIETTYVCSGQPSICNTCSDLTEVIVPHRATDIDENTQTISYSAFTTHTYGTNPIVLATPNSQNNSDNYPIPRISNITKTGFDISICMDAWATTCDPAPNPEDIAIFVVDTTLATCRDDIETGITSVTTNGTNTAFTFATGFSNVPYIYTTPQTSNQWNNIAVTAWVDNVGLSTAWAQFIWCSHQWVGDTCTAGTNEDLWWLAIDPILFTGITTLAQWTANIPDSQWTTISYAWAGYTQSPVVMATQNSELGAQDGQYPWARTVGNSSAQIRYCEADGANYCDGHNAENVRWFSLPVFACWDGMIDSSESCDDGGTTSWDWCSSSCQIEWGYTCTWEASVCTLCSVNPTPIIGHQVTALDDNRVTVNYSSFTTVWFNSTPYVFATPNSQNNGDNYPIPRIRNVTTGSFDVSVCLDRGATTCDATAADEDLAIFVVDQDSASCSVGIQAWTIDATTNGANTAVSFGTSFTSNPYIFTTAQTSNQSGNIAAHSRVDDVTLLWANLLWCTHQWIANACDTWQPSETFARLAIDPLTFTMEGFQTGFGDITDSAWTPMTFSPAYTEIPWVMVTQNDDDGWEDGQYPWARTVGTWWGEFRYCEADAADVCNSHASEIVRWFSLPFSVLGDICLEAPSSFSWSGSTIVSLPNAMSYEQQFSGYFTVTDNGWGDLWYYTTLELSSLTWLTYGDVLPSSSVEWYATGVDFISWSINTGVVLAPWFTWYTTALGAITFIQRDTWVGVGITWTYWASPFLRITIPPYTRPDSYQWVMTYTLYEN